MANKKNKNFFSKNMNFIFICVNFNSASTTKNFLLSVEALNDEKMAIQASSIVVDNASAPNDFAELKIAVNKCENARLIKSIENQGYFAGLNLGLSNLKNYNFDYVIVGNNDLIFRADFLRQLSSRSYPADVLVIAPNIVTIDGYHQNPHCINRVTIVKKFIYNLYFLNYGIALLFGLGSSMLKRFRGGRRNREAYKSQYIHMGIGACYVLTKSFFRHYSKFNDPVFLYGEEALLAGQVMAASGKTFYDSGLWVTHAESATVSKLPAKMNYKFARDSYPKYRKFL